MLVFVYDRKIGSMSIFEDYYLPADPSF